MNSKLAYACVGKSKSQGGLNLPEFREALSKKYPQEANKIRSIKTRKSLQRYCRYESPKIKKDVRITKEKYFTKRAISERKISNKQQKYCRCIAHVAGKNKEWCYEHNAWKKGSGKCYNPYAVCSSRVGRDSKYCARYYDLDNMPVKEVKALANMKGMSVSKYKTFVKKEQEKLGLI